MSDSPSENHRMQPKQRIDHPDDAHLEEEEKLLEGRHDVNYPALLTRDVKGG